MKRITTESGSEYLYDDINLRFLRESVVGDRGLKNADGVWHDAFPVETIEVGKPVLWRYLNPESTGSLLAAGAEARIRQTTRVVSVVEVIPPLLESGPGDGL